MIDTIQFPRKIDDNGYVRINFEGKWVLEHRFIMEEYLGRILTFEEKIHHDDFCRQNNHISNLTLFPNDKSHARFHRQIRQFSITQPRRTQILKLKEIMLKEHLSHRTE